MLTGVEIAGIVLATLPLVITVIQEREVGIRPVDALLFTSSRRIKVSQILSDQRLRFRFFCERLLCEVGVENVADYLSVDEKNRSIWAQPELKQKFLERLGGSYENFDRKMREVDSRITRIQKYAKKSILFFSLESLANSKDIVRLQECISSLREFAIDLPYSQWFQDQIPEEIELINSRSKDLHKCIERSWECQCKDRHELYVKVSSGAKERSLSLLFVSNNALESVDVKSEQNSWSWLSTTFSGDEKYVGSKEIQSSKSLCKALSGIASEDKRTSQHLLSLDLKGPPRQLYADDSQLSNASLITLQHELARRDGELRIYSIYLGVRDCVSLAILLLSALLKYHWTPWLSSEWSSDSVFFMRRGESLSRSALNEPLLRSKFQDNSSTRQSMSSTLFFELGIMLLEIVHGNPFLSLMTEKEKEGAVQTDPEDRLMWKTRAAWRLFKTLPAHMCLKSYKEAIERCLKNQFVDDVDKSLSDKKFRAAVYSKAVEPLLKDFARVE